MNRYRRGRIAEKKVANWLKDKGFTNIRRSKGSRRPADIYARSPAGVKTYVQVKPHTASLDSRGKMRLRGLAKNRRGAAMDVHYNGPGKIKTRFWGNWSRRR